MYLTSMTPQQELGVFLENRAACCRDNERLAEARAAFAEAHRLEPRSANTLTGLRIVCGIGQGTHAPENPAAQAWLRGPMPPDPADPTPRITMPMPGVNPNPAFATPSPLMGRPNKEVRR